MRRFVKRKDVAIKINRASISLNNVVYRSPDVTDEFYFESSVSSDNGKACTALVDPIKILFSQKLIDNNSIRAVENIIDSFKNYQVDPLAELRTKCSDSDLKKIIKSRHIQQPCEIIAWARACEADMQSFTSELQALQQQQITANTQQADNQSNNE